jgi:DNA-directed RNA polymerase specialized sigma24 family protein
MIRSPPGKPVYRRGSPVAASKSSRPIITRWEFALVKKVTSRFRTRDPDELEFDLCCLLLELKTKPRENIRNWKAYVAKFLHNKASNWVRNQRRVDVKMLSLQDLRKNEDEEMLSSSEILRSPEVEPETRLAFRDLWRELDPNLRRLWKMLLVEGGNQAKVARRLGKHRNTIRLWIRTIQNILRRHGYGA